jgi:hypothetical protein
MSDVICTSKSRQLLGQPSFFYSNKKKVRGGERERENTMKVCERELSKVVHFLVVQISLLFALIFKLIYVYRETYNHQ